ncbi:thioredoxin domain-containing protein [Streptomyces sp. NPDC001594]|uniref:thioredoxin domain-containing protein n=1 Tax=Streptomyces sp. NPDC001594 TaxID=3364590 RepID=UPI0036BF9CC5
MSAPDPHNGKTAARERLRAERARQATKDKRRRRLLAATAMAGLLAVVGTTAYLVVQANEPTAWEAAKTAKLVEPAHTTGPDGTTVVLGKADAPKTLKVYEDMRCPFCATFEQAVGPSVDKDLESGKYKVQYVIGTFLDNPGEGSRNALSALGAALNVSPDAFLAYKQELFSAKYHPQESEDTFKSDKYLIQVADQVSALKDNAAFRKAVTDGTYDRWALEMSEKFTTNEDGATGTPTLVMDGRKLTTADGATPLTAAAYEDAIGKALAGK